MPDMQTDLYQTGYEEAEWISRDWESESLHQYEDDELVSMHWDNTEFGELSYVLAEMEDYFQVQNNSTPDWLIYMIKFYIKGVEYRINVVKMIQNS